MLKVLRKRNFALLWVGQLISMMGDWLLVTALPYYIYQITGSALATGAMFMVQIIPRLLLGTVAGVFVDRWDSRRIMIVGDLLRAFVLLLLLAVPVLGWVWIVYLVGLSESVLSQFFFPAERALLPRVVGRDQVREANSLYAIGSNFARIVGPALGGAVMAVFDLHAVVLLDTASYLVSAAFVVLIALPWQTTAPQAGSVSVRAALSDVWRDWVEVLQLVRTNRFLAGIFITIGVTMIGDAMVSPLFVMYVEDVLHGGAQELGWVLAARGLGGMIGGMLLGQLGRRISTSTLITGGIALTGLIFLVIVNVSKLVVVLPLFVLIGIPAMAWVITPEAAIQQHGDAQYLGRIFGAYGTTTAISMLIGMGTAGLLGDAIGIVPTLNLSVAITLLAAVVSFVLLRQAPKPEHSYQSG